MPVLTPRSGPSCPYYVLPCFAYLLILWYATLFWWEAWNPKSGSTACSLTKPSSMSQNSIGHSDSDTNPLLSDCSRLGSCNLSLAQVFYATILVGHRLERTCTVLKDIQRRTKMFQLWPASARSKDPDIHGFRQLQPWTSMRRCWTNIESGQIKGHLKQSHWKQRSLETFEPKE